jgi:hypothetical protein
LGNGNIAVGTDIGFSIYYGNTWVNFDSTNSALKRNNIEYVKSTPGNGCWVVTKNFTDSINYYPGFYFYQNGQLTSLKDIDPTCSYAKVDGNTLKLYMVDNTGNLIVRLDNHYFKKYPLPTGPQTEYNFVSSNFGQSAYNATQIAEKGVYSNYGFDCFLYKDKLCVIMDTSFISATVGTLLAESIDIGIIDINNIKQTVRVRGDLFSKGQPFTQNESPIGTCKSINAYGGLWLGGVDQNGYLRSAAVTYRQQGVDYFPGPLDTTNATTTQAVMSQYNKVWKINKSMIQYFQQVYQTDPQLIPNDILTWPGNGTGNQAHYLAPFVDLNSNGDYEPLLGDYPELTGDEMLYWIFNDAGGPHTEFGCQPLGAEIHGMAYAYACDDIDPNSNNEALNNTVFYKYTIHNRGTFTFEDFYVGWWQDPDLGKFNDDYVGCDTLRNAGFIYNGFNNDDGLNGYGLNPPMQSYVQLDGPLAEANDGKDNDHDGTIDEIGEKILFANFVYYNNDFSIIGNPENCSHIYSYLRCRTKDNTPFVNNGTNGYGSGPVTHYLFSGIPYTNQGWTETSAGNNPGDRRLLISSGPSDLPPGSATSVEYAIIYSHYDDAPNGANTSFALNNAYVDSVTSWYNAQAFPSCYNPTSVVETPGGIGKLNVYPNPTTNMVTINIGGKSDALDYCVTDMAGKTVMCGKGNTINLDGFANGMYLLYAQNNDGVFYTKLIKQ